MTLAAVRRSSGRRVADLLERAVEVTLLRMPDDDDAAASLGIPADDVRAWRAELHGGPLALGLVDDDRPPVEQPPVEPPVPVLVWNGQRFVGRG